MPVAAGSWVHDQFDGAVGGAGGKGAQVVVDKRCPIDMVRCAAELFGESLGEGFDAVGLMRAVEEGAGGVDQRGFGAEIDALHCGRTLCHTPRLR